MHLVVYIYVYLPYAYHDSVIWTAQGEVYYLSLYLNESDDNRRNNQSKYGLKWAQVKSYFGDEKEW